MPSHSFQWPVRVYIEDTDAGGIVYYANYLRFMERARTEFIRSLGFPRLETIDPSVLFVVHSLNLTYHRPARLDQELVVSADMAKLGRTYMVFNQKVMDGKHGDVLVSGEVMVACINQASFKPVRLPVPLNEALR